MYSIAAPVIGALITIMNSINSRFSSLVGALPAALAIHMAGMVFISITAGALWVSARLKGHTAARAKRLPWYLYMGGVTGVGTVLTCNYTYSALDASLAVALGLIGQTVVSITADSAGFLGKRKEPLSYGRIPGIVLAILGALVIAREWRSELLPIAVALGSGVCIGFNALLNAEHGRRNGTIRSAQWNYITGLSVTVVIVAASGPDWAGAAAMVVDAGAVLATGGAFFGVIIVLSLNAVFVRLPAFRATLLLFAGQALMGVMLDAYTAGFVDIRKLAGTALVLCGLALDSWAHRRSANPAPVHRNG